MAPLILLLSLEVMHLSFPGAAESVSKSSFYAVKLIINYLFLLSWECILYTLTQSAFTANLITTAVMFMLGFSTEVLGRINGNPLLPSDLFLIKNANDIASFAQIPLIPSAVAAAAISIISLVIHFYICKTRKKDLPLRKRLRYGVLSIAFFLISTHALCINPYVRYRVLPRMDVELSEFNPIADYMQHGAILTFFPRIGDLIIEKAEDYGEFAVYALQYQYEPAASVEANRQVNVIIIQNEAWWDPAQMPEVSYSTDLLSGIHSLKKNTVRGTFLSPVYAGGTCMPEFEVLTGISTYFLPESAYPYTQYITNQTPSFASILREAGYQTVALHPYKKNFYSRSTAYPLLGFETFKGIDEFLYQDKSGAYVDDMACVKQIIHEFEHKTKERIFEFVVTMENHGTYTMPRYESFDFEMEAPTLSEKDAVELMRYSQGVYHADKAFMALVDYFQTVEEPVILAMYGDHLPLLGTKGSTYMDGGFVEHEDPFVSSAHPHLYETPYVVWTNYNKPNFNLEPKISGNTLGLRLFLASGNEAPWYLNVMDAFSQKYPGVCNTAIYNEAMEPIQSFDPADESLVKGYQMLIYDILHGKQYCRQDPSLP